MVDHVRATATTASQDELDGALWNACARGDSVIARLLIGFGAHLDWMAPWNGQTPLDAARSRHQNHILRSAARAGLTGSRRPRQQRPAVDLNPPQADRRPLDR
ncbi:MAG TPA: hypothetical protein VGL48_07720 [Acidimicrobiales bacterium]|jgi:hypothetical protein